MDDSTRTIYESCCSGEEHSAAAVIVIAATMASSNGEFAYPFAGTPGLYSTLSRDGEWMSSM